MPEKLASRLAVLRDKVDDSGVPDKAADIAKDVTTRVCNLAGFLHHEASRLWTPLKKRLQDRYKAYRESVDPKE